MTPEVMLHAGAGTIGMLSGFTALAIRKGSEPPRHPSLHSPLRHSRADGFLAHRVLFTRWQREDTHEAATATQEATS